MNNHSLLTVNEIMKYTIIQMRSIVFILTLVVPLFTLSQNLPECDSVVIDCCLYDTYNPNTVDIEVSNYSSNIFSYPGFILFDLNMDTIAKETVNYYGIGWNQIHSMNILEPFDLPFEGILELHGGFYNSHICTFPITIPDTVQTSFQSEEINELSVYPNPVTDFLTINLKNQNVLHRLRISDLNGRIVRDYSITDKKTIDVSDLNSGIYFVTLNSNKNTIDRIKLVKK